MSNLQPFHLAIPVTDLHETRYFYNTLLGFKEGRSSERWVDLNFFGHQLVLHLVDEHPSARFNPVDGLQVPVPHFGVVLSWDDFHAFVSRLEQHQVKFNIAPYIRFKGLVGEQATCFFKDPSGNALEFKAFKDIGQLFAK